MENKDMIALSENFFETVHKINVAIVEEHCSSAELVRKLKAFGATRQDRINAVHVPPEKGFNCVVHNDAWINNFMFRYIYVDSSNLKLSKPAIVPTNYCFMQT